MYFIDTLHCILTGINSCQLYTVSRLSFPRTRLRTAIHCLAVYFLINLLYSISLSLCLWRSIFVCTNQLQPQVDCCRTGIPSFDGYIRTRGH
ncbi:hypothetical protein BT96DRAFT_363448 [Gymnopus androsaceus JB14]|uniref:Uncharacterized protein n=1 Tax=Gymnopus androsaceus JB14 TaxID=1447944 RepID=A0A6A4GW03_9AGAR|nr:hypothetical protein BT96DRAFT_363448 [Gymnopus androsaceus JB14]